MFREGDPPHERWFSSSAPDVAYLVWEIADPRAAVNLLKADGVDAEVVPGP